MRPVAARATLSSPGARIGALQDGLDRNGRFAGWPVTGGLQLDGCNYGRLGGLQGDKASDMIRRDVSWYVEWLARSPTDTTLFVGAGSLRGGLRC
jgi:hypothetical protein